MRNPDTCRLLASTISLRLGTTALPASAGRPPTKPPATPAATPAATSAGPLISMRQHWLDGDINSFNFRNSSEIFETRTVTTDGEVWVLPKGPAAAMAASYDTLGRLSRDHRRVAEAGQSSMIRAASRSTSARSWLT